MSFTVPLCRAHHPVAPVELWPTEAAFDEATAEFAKQGNLGVPEGPMSFQQLFKMCAERSKPLNGLKEIPYPRNREFTYADQGIYLHKSGNSIQQSRVFDSDFREIAFQLLNCRQGGFWASTELW